ncbi:MAG TPA: porin [Candidatus Brocadiia bacterium]|nr:porin [Candidatus Brocadiales bacterium]
MKLRFVLTLFAVAFFVCKGAHGQTSLSMPPDVSGEDLKAQVERMERMLEEQQKQISELKHVLEEKTKEKEVKEAVKDEKIEEVVEKYLEKEETKEKFAELGLSPNLKMGYKKGFYLETLDEKFKLRFQGGLQFRYEFLDRNEGEEDTSSFLIRRARMILEGNAFSPNIKYKLQAGFDKGTDFNLLDYYFNMTHIPPLNVQFGQFKAPFNRQRITSSGNLQLVDRSTANEVFNLDRQIGMMLHSMLFDKRFEYGFGVFNGSSVTGVDASSGRNLKENDNNRHLFVLRAAYNPFGEFGYSESDVEFSEKLKATIAGAAGYSSDEITVSGSEEDVDTTRLVGELGLKYRGFSFLTEGYYRHRDAGDLSGIVSRGNIADNGFFTQAGYFIIPKRLEIAGRHSFVDFDDDVPLGGVDELREYTGGINYFFEGHRSKLQANIVRVEEDLLTGEDEKDNKFQLQYQIYF